MTTVKTEIYESVKSGFRYLFETLYAGNQNMVYRINGRMVTPEIWFNIKENIDFIPEIIKKIK